MISTHDAMLVHVLLVSLILNESHKCTRLVATRIPERIYTCYNADDWLRNPGKHRLMEYHESLRHVHSATRLLDNIALATGKTRGYSLVRNRIKRKQTEKQIQHSVDEKGVGFPRGRLWAPAYFPFHRCNGTE